MEGEREVLCRTPTPLPAYFPLLSVPAYSALLSIPERPRPCFSAIVGGCWDLLEERTRCSIVECGELMAHSCRALGPPVFPISS